ESSCQPFLKIGLFPLAGSTSFENVLLRRPVFARCRLGARSNWSTVTPRVVFRPPSHLDGSLLARITLFRHGPTAADSSQGRSSRVDLPGFRRLILVGVVNHDE